MPIRFWTWPSMSQAAGEPCGHRAVTGYTFTTMAAWAQQTPAVAHPSAWQPAFSPQHALGASVLDGPPFSTRTWMTWQPLPSCPITGMNTFWYTSPRGAGGQQAWMGQQP